MPKKKLVIVTLYYLLFCTGCIVNKDQGNQDQAITSLKNGNSDNGPHDGSGPTKQSSDANKEWGKKFWKDRTLKMLGFISKTLPKKEKCSVKLGKENRFLYEDVKGNVLIMNQKELERCKLSYDKEKQILVDHNGKPSSTYGKQATQGRSDGNNKQIVVMTKGNIHIGTCVEDKFHHISFVGSAGVEFSGVICTNKGKVEYIGAESGHYWPGMIVLHGFIEHLKQKMPGVFAENCTVGYFSYDSEKPQDFNFSFELNLPHYQESSLPDFKELMDKPNKHGRSRFEEMKAEVEREAIKKKKEKEEWKLKAPISMYDILNAYDRLSSQEKVDVTEFPVTSSKTQHTRVYSIDEIRRLIASSLYTIEWLQKFGSKGILQNKHFSISKIEEQILLEGQSKKLGPLIEYTYEENIAIVNRGLMHFFIDFIPTIGPRSIPSCCFLTRALQVAVENNRPKIVKILLEHAVEGDHVDIVEIFECAVRKRYPEIVQILLEQGTKLAVEDLTRAVESNNLKAVDIILDHLARFINRGLCEMQDKNSEIFKIVFEFYKKLIDEHLVTAKKKGYTEIVACLEQAIDVLKEQESSLGGGTH